ncbi:MAG: hypothetical protein HY057_12520 [Rhodospirillales bacterium]|nr:hypothetical protein [Rhodospirillales bacterium]
MITLREASLGLTGAWQLAKRDPAGMQYFDASIDGFWRSFYAALIAAPAYVMLAGLRLVERPVATSSLRIVLIEAIAYVVGWVAYPLITFYLAAALERRERYLGYIVAYNWATVIQVAVYLPIAALAATGVAPEAVIGIVGAVIAIAVLTYQYYIARIALDVMPMAAVGLLIVDIFLSLALNGTVETLEMR